MFTSSFSCRCSCLRVHLSDIACSSRCSLIHRRGECCRWTLRRILRRSREVLSSMSPWIRVTNAPLPVLVAACVYRHRHERSVKEELFSNDEFPICYQVTFTMMHFSSQERINASKQILQGTVCQNEHKLSEAVLFLLDTKPGL